MPGCALKLREKQPGMHMSDVMTPQRSDKIEKSITRMANKIDLFGRAISDSVDALAADDSPSLDANSRAEALRRKGELRKIHECMLAISTTVTDVTLVCRDYHVEHAESIEQLRVKAEKYQILLDEKRKRSTIAEFLGKIPSVARGLMAVLVLAGAIIGAIIGALIIYAKQG